MRNAAKGLLLVGVLIPAQAAEYAVTAVATSVNRDGTLAVLALAMLVSIGMFTFIVRKFVKRRHEARMYVLVSKDSVAVLLAEGELLARNPYVTVDTREEFEEELDAFAPFAQLSANANEGHDWIWLASSLATIREGLTGSRNVLQKMRREIAFADKVLREGPRLLAELPVALEVLRQELAQGRRSAPAWRYWRHARKCLCEAERLTTLSEPPSWVMRYGFLESAKDALHRAEETHREHVQQMAQDEQLPVRAV
jgi:hypothetical protein